MDSKRLAEIADVMEDRGLTRVRVEEPDGCLLYTSPSPRDTR